MERACSCTDIYTAANLLKVVECCRLQTPDLPAGPLHPTPERCRHLKGENQELDTAVITNATRRHA